MEMSNTNKSDGDKGNSGTDPQQEENRWEEVTGDEQTGDWDDLAAVSQAPPSSDEAKSTKTADGPQQASRANQEVRSRMMTAYFSQPKVAETNSDLSSGKMFKSFHPSTVKLQSPHNLEHPRQQYTGLQHSHNQKPHEEELKKKLYSQENNNTASFRSAQACLQQSSASSNVYFTVGLSDLPVNPLPSSQVQKSKSVEEPHRDTILSQNQSEKYNAGISSGCSTIDLQNAAASTKSTEPSVIGAETANLDICDHLINARSVEASHSEVEGILQSDFCQSLRAPENDECREGDRNIRISSRSSLEGQQECGHSDETNGYANHRLETETSREQNYSSGASAATPNQLSFGCQSSENYLYAFSIHNVQAIVQQRPQADRAGEHGDSVADLVSLAIQPIDAAGSAGRAGPRPSASTTERSTTSSSTAFSGRSLQIGVKLRGHVDVDEKAQFNSFPTTGKYGPITSRIRQLIRADQLQVWGEDLHIEHQVQGDGSVPFESLTDGLSWGSELCDVCHVRPTLIILFNCHCSFCDVCFYARSPLPNLTTCPLCGVLILFAYCR